MHNRWCEQIDNYFNTCRIPETPLSGVTVRVRRSSRQQPICDVGHAMETALKKYGANIKIIEDLNSDLACEHGKVRLAGIDAFIMLATTTGVSAEALELAHLKDEGEPPLRDRLYVAMPKEYSDGFIRKRLDYHRVNLDLYEDSDLTGGVVCRRAISKLVEQKRERDAIMKAKANEYKPKIGIVTALPIEYEAMVSLLQNPRDHRFMSTPGSLHEYRHGTLPAYNGGEHAVVVARSGVGNNFAAAMAQQLIGDYITLDVVFMVGIAGGIPYVKDGDPDIRFGDVVMSGRMGVIQYDMVKDTLKGQEPNHPPRAPAEAWLRRATSFINADSEMDDFNARLERITADPKFKRPPSETDKLVDDSDPQNPKEIERPLRTKSGSLAFEGAVGSANRVVKSHCVREELREKHKLLAVEMEGSGVADAAMANGTSFFVIRGICDYANDGKNKVWQPFAAMSAAVFAATLIKSMPLTSSK
ncbi:5'-methylthioadenosine/S-adenosylhomocysteine nucleosidase [Methylocaldum sp. 14B]|uniref:5'-methylthioadenosine/S-adenosylhomocysteine nucleosidase n=1 Tax=Methylocaldum sp. 14B TaxID=1912213 RepID=UPI000989B998|nr:5'-methylthioadenosine/S-adenosylhomocysteine nucleosidase [Methylocaldum sp. 14B]